MEISLPAGYAFSGPEARPSSASPPHRGPPSHAANQGQSIGGESRKVCRVFPSLDLLLERFLPLHPLFLARVRRMGAAGIAMAARLRRQGKERRQPVARLGMGEG
jgi:hypothetical protein